MQVVILGFDALEHTKAKDMPRLAQVECRKLKNNIGLVNPSTPILWASIITGKMPKEHGIDRVLWKKKHLKCKTWFDLVPGSVAIQVPPWNITELPGGRMTRAMGKPAAMRKLAEEQMEQFRNRAEMTLKALDENPPMIMTHFYATDMIGHMFAWNKAMMDELYEYAAEVTEKAVKKVGKKGCVIVQSDHGMLIRQGGRVVLPGQPKATRGYHTNYAFFSSSIPIGLPEKAHITDIFPIVMDLVEMPSPEETEILKNRLKKLGYID